MHISPAMQQLPAKRWRFSPHAFAVIFALLSTRHIFLQKHEVEHLLGNPPNSFLGASQPRFSYLRPTWTTVADFLNVCSDFVETATFLTSPNATTKAMHALKPLFHPLTFDEARRALDEYQAQKVEANTPQRRTDERPQECLPWDNVHDAVPYGQRPLRIAVFTTATKDSKDLFGNAYNAEQQATYDRAYQLSIEDKQQYCHRHGYDFHVFDKVIEGRSVGWCRIPAALSLLHRYDWVFHVDLDSVILDHSVKLMEFLDPRYDLIIGVDMNGINNGVYCLRNSTWSRLFYAEAWTRTQEHNSHVWFEQAAMMALMAQSHGVRNHMKLIPQDMFNTYPGPGGELPDGTGPFIVHFPGRGDKWELVERYLAQYT